MPLNTAAAFHTPLVAQAAGPLYDFAKGLDWRQPAIPVVSSRTGRPHGQPESLAVALALQLASPVLWTATLGFLQRAGVRRIISATPGRALNRLTSATLPGLEAVNWQDLNLNQNTKEPRA
jgi:malonyl CoA-acyl carrier protein transacylase